MINTANYIHKNIQNIKYEKYYLLNHSDNAKQHMINATTSGLAIAVVLYRIGFHKIMKHIQYSKNEHALLLYDRDYHVYGIANPTTWLALYKDFGILGING